MPKTYFDEENLTIEVDTGSHPYQVDLERCTDSASTLDWILQIADKGWCTPQTLFDFITCLNEACQKVFGKNAQGVFCSFEQDHEVNWLDSRSRPKE